ncbi:MAG: DNA repair protein RecN [Acidimicrobiales bacterium]
MLAEIRVRDLGVIESLDLILRDGLTAVTGETGAGKTLVVEALELLLGSRADANLVRAGADCAVVEGRFLEGERELALRRELPVDGRSRAYADGRMASASELGQLGSGLVDLHGQHSHQSLLHQGAQRAALDLFAGTDTTEVEDLEEAIASLDRRLESLGGDQASLRREVELLRFQADELDRARITDAGEEERLGAEERLLSSLDELRMATAAARGMISGEEPAGDGAAALLAGAAREIGPHESLADLAGRLLALEAEAGDVASELRRRRESYDDDPGRLALVRERLAVLGELRRKYGGSLVEALAHLAAAKARLDDLESAQELRSQLGAERARLSTDLARAESRLLEVRSKAAPVLAERIEAHLCRLALDQARFRVGVGGPRGEQVSFLLSANPGEPALPLSKVASGGELARVMLAARLVLSEAPGTLVFDEVDAGVGGEAAVAVGSALHELAREHQVLVVTHLAQVAAFADAHVVVRKVVENGRTLAGASEVAGEERLVELSRMLSGRPGSATARRHAAELLSLAGSDR